MHLLNTSLSLNDLADALEALHVRASWTVAEKRNALDARARERALKEAQKEARRMAGGHR